VKLEEIKELIGSLEKGNLKKIVIKKGDFELQLEKESYSTAALPPPPPASHYPAPAKHEAHEEHKPSAKGAAAAAKPGKYVTSPMVGTFYSSSAPDQPPFVKVGDRVQENTVICIIEAMKVMNEVKAGISGVVAEVLMENTHPVEFGSKLFRIV
jgi:acetyl-CoA carboxylase biotin carboxyl carrier protein